MPKNFFLRALIGTPIAAVIAYGLFILMATLIAAEYNPDDETEIRKIERITPEQRDQEVRAKSRSKPKRLASADKPPPPPKLSASKADINLPTPQIQGAAPTEVRFDRVQSLDINPVAISDRDATPIRPPVPTYPNRALERGTEGECSVSFNVDVRGRPYDVKADCSDSIFKREAERAVSRVEFAPKIVRGKPTERRNVVYPLVFSLSE
jgi:protein TonB